EADTLTSLPNRRRFSSELERAVGQAGRHGTPVAMLLIRLEGLEAINTQHGRLAGDATLVHVAALLASLIRATDVLARID
ncbi:GGDEF domain-containing protein, partial [Escherichia coli]|uniref:GGDEF domain-containing protein n=1 Tax=Escherichia coli TaxID=562 RepID=UPI0015C46D04